MDRIEQFFELIEKHQTAVLATSGTDGVSMRTVSPVRNGKSVVLFTAASSRKFAQLKENPRCCLEIGPFFAECRAELLGSTMLEQNAELRKVYDAKFPGAFDENIAFGGFGADFVVLTPVRLSGWAFENDVPVEGGIPTVPFDIKLD